MRRMRLGGVEGGLLQIVEFVRSLRGCFPFQQIMGKELSLTYATDQQPSLSSCNHAHTHTPLFEFAYDYFIVVCPKQLGPTLVWFLIWWDTATSLLYCTFSRGSIFPRMMRNVLTKYLIWVEVVAILHLMKSFLLTFDEAAGRQAWQYKSAKSRGCFFVRPSSRWQLAVTSAVLVPKVHQARFRTERHRAQATVGTEGLFTNIRMYRVRRHPHC